MKCHRNFQPTPIGVLRCIGLCVYVWQVAPHLSSRLYILCGWKENRWKKKRKKKKGEEKDIFHPLNHKKLEEERKYYKWNHKKTFFAPMQRKLQQERNVTNIHFCPQKLLSINTRRQKSKKGDWYAV